MNDQCYGCTEPTENFCPCCGTPICENCVDEFDGEPMCPDCVLATEEAADE